MKKLFMFMAALVMAQMATAIPAKRVVRTVSQPDGTTLQVMLRGDETFHFYTTPDGIHMRQSSSGQWVVDTRDVSRMWRERVEERAAQRRPHAEKMRKLLHDSSLKAARRVKRAPDATEQTDDMHKKGLLILVNFNDVKLTTPASKIKEVYNQILNSEDNPYGDNYGSVHEYFLDQSYGQLHVTFDIAGPVTLSKNMSYYGKNQDNDEPNVGEMIHDAIDGVKNEVNFADYDWDGDGEVENVYITYAGYGEASGASENTVWPHQWDLISSTGSSLTYNGITVNTYACGSELAGTSGSTLDGIGTMCHEYSHCLGLPDFYDTRSNGDNFGMSVWSLMDYGCYNGDGYCPAGYTAYERMYSGWLTPTELNSKTAVTGLKPIEDEPEAYIVYNDANHDEYYLLANHQHRGWDSEAYGHGMMITHVDYDRSAWENNVVNNTTSRQRMTIFAADGSAKSGSTYNEMIRNVRGDLYPGPTGNTSLTDDSTPKAILYNSNTDGTKLMQKSITDITESNDLISFNFMYDSKMAVPVLDDTPLSVEKRSFVASWGEVEGAVSYNLRYRQVTVNDDPSGDDILEYCALIEDFEKFYDEKDGSTDLSSRLDDYTVESGWTGSKVYKGTDGAKLGSSRASGFLTTPLLTNLKSRQLSMYLGVESWLNSSGVADNTTVEVVLLDANDNELDVFTTEPNDEYLIEVQFDNVPSEAKVCFRSNGNTKNRFYMSFVLIADGDMSVLDSLYDYFYSDTEAGEDWSDYANQRLARRKAHARRQPSARQRSTRRNIITYGEWVTVKDITDTRYTVSGLEYACLYEYQVQAVDNESGTSRWSVSQRVQLSGTVDVAQTPVAAQPTPTVTYDISGRRVPSTPKAGLYIRNGRKVVVR